MPSILELIFWLSAALVVYAYLGYPLLILLLSRLRPRPVHRNQSPNETVSIVLAAHNEEAAIARRVRELSSLLTSLPRPGELIVVSDGSTDATADAARNADSPLLRVIELPANRGKAVALNHGCAAATGRVIVFADARQTWAPDALQRLLENFADPTVGAASGDLVLQAGLGVMDGLGLYWRFEKWLRRREGQLHSTVGATGAISALRKSLYSPIPPGTILDDVFWPLRVAMQGYRVVHDERAKAFDRLPDTPKGEFRRKVRTLSGNFQLIARLPAALLPWRNPICFQFISHKLLRLLVPWLLLTILALSALLPGPIYAAALAAQLAFYALGLLGLNPRLASHLRIASAAASFLVLNAAAFLAFWVYLTGNAGRSWKKTAYKPPYQPVGPANEPIH